MTTPSLVCAVTVAVGASCFVSASHAGDVPLACAPGRPAENCKPARAPTVVVTGTRTEHLEDDAPVPTQVITHETISETATDNVEAVLRQVSDVHVTRNEQFSLGASTVRMQGLDPNKVAIVVDGRRTLGGIDGVVDLRDIPAEGIEQVEIIRGPASSLYGSDAMAGVINIRTRRGSAEPEASATVAGGTAGKQLFGATLSHRVAGVDYFIAAQRDAVEIADLYGAVSAQFAGEDADSLQTRDSARLRMHSVGARDEFDFSTDYLRETNPLSDNDNLSASLSWSGELGAGWFVDTAASGYLFHRENTLPGFLEEIEYFDFTSEVRLRRTFGDFLGADHLLTLGTRFRTERVETPTQSLGGQLASAEIDESVYLVSPFLQLESLVGADLSLTLGASLDIHELYGARVSPRATATWRPTASLKLSATVGLGYRAPDLRQLYSVDINNVAVIGDRVSGYAIVGNPDLDPETDLGVTLYGEYRGVRGLRLTMDAFRHEVRNLIGTELLCFGSDNCIPGVDNPLPELDGQVFSYASISEARTQGGNLNLNLIPQEWFGWGERGRTLELALGLGLLDTENRGNLAGERGMQLPFRPPLRVLPGIAYRREDTGFRLRVLGELNGRQFSDFANTGAGEIDAHWLWGFKATQSVGGFASLWGADAPEWIRGLDLFVSGDNVFDEEVGFVGPTGAIVRKRNFTVGLRAGHQF